MSSNLSAQLNFLSDAAHLLSRTAPETSAYLMSRRTNLVLNHDLPTSAVQQQHVCSCCGHIMQVGSRLKFQARQGPPSRSRRQGARKTEVGRSAVPGSAASKVFTCGNCGRDTAIALPPPNPISRKKPVRPQEPSVQNTQTRKPSAGASSRKRAKSRKAGLQALLVNRGANQPKASGLSLTDFMKK